MVGGQDSVAALFNFSNYDLTSWMTDYYGTMLSGTITRNGGIIARRDQGTFSMRLLPTDRRQQHIERGCMDTL